MRLKELHIELNHFCNLNCVMCEHPLSVGVPGLTPADLDAILASKTLMQAGTVSLTGGEPTLSGIFLPAAKALACAGKRLIVLTNLYELSALELFLKELDREKTARTHVGSSVDGLEKVHDSIRGKDGAYGRLLKNALFLKKNRAVSLSLTFTVSRLNLREFEKVFDLFYRKEGIPVFPQYVIPSRPGNERLIPDKKEKKEFIETLRRISAKTPSAEFFFSPFLDTGEKKTVCGAGLDFLFVSPEAEIYACPQDKKLVLGSIRAGNIDKILKERPKALNRMNRKNCAGCLLKCRS